MNFFARYFFIHFITISSSCAADTQKLLDTVYSFGCPSVLARELIKEAATRELISTIACKKEVIKEGSPLLFEKFPKLSNTISYTSLADLPTPVARLHTIETSIGVEQLWIKRDDLTAKKFGLAGGNKVRKLEFLLADALAAGASTVLTFGCVGSNHAVATACYTQQQGLSCITMLKPQPNNAVVQTNLLKMCAYNAQMIWSSNTIARAIDTVCTILKSIQKDHNIPYIIPTGGSCPLGVLGYINAVFELKEQIDKNEVPEPDYIYVPTGSTGTIVGILLGIQATGLHSKIIGITTEPSSALTFEKKIKDLFIKTNQFLHQQDSSFALFEYPSDQIRIYTAECGTEYGAFTEHGTQAYTLMREQENIILDGTYTAKTFAGLIADIQEHSLHNAIILYWHTYDSSPLQKLIDYTELPSDFHSYFTENIY